jgi:hypothetical protein
MPAEIYRTGNFKDFTFHLLLLRLLNQGCKGKGKVIPVTGREGP